MTFKVLGGMAPNRRCGMTLAVVALMTWGCGGDGDAKPPAMPGTMNPAPAGGTGGGGTAVTPGTGGTGGTGGGGAVTVRDGGSTITPPSSTPGQSGMAVAKFCNGLRRQSGPIEFTLEVGTPPVKFVAVSGKCTPPAGQPCLTIPAGPMVNVSLYLDGMPMAIGTGAFEIPAGQDVVFEPTLVMDQMGMPALSLEGSVYPPGVCPDIDLIDVGDGGAPPGNRDAGPGRPPGI